MAYGRSGGIRELFINTHPSYSVPVGYGYNTRLSEFVRDYWDLERAATISPSLKRTLDRLSESKYAGTNR